RISTYEKLDPTTAKGKEFQKSLQGDKSEDIKKMALPDKPELDKAINTLRELLSDPQYAQIYQKFMRLKGKKVWYRLDNGPDNLKELAYSVGQHALYDFMYSYWSRIAHASDFAPFVLP